MLTTVQYTVSENKLIVTTGIEPVGQVRLHILDDMQDNYYDEEGSLIRSEITALQRLPKMEQNRMIASFYAEPEERAKAKKAADKLAKEKAEVAEKAAKKAAAEARKLAKEEADRIAAEAVENEVVTPNAKASVKAIDEFAERYAINETEEYQNAATKAEKVAVINALFVNE